MKRLWRFDITLTLRAPILTAAQGGRRFGLDSAVQRDWNDCPALAGSLVRGNLRHAWNEFKELAPCSAGLDIKRWLGSQAAEENNSPNRGLLSFSHWFAATSQGAADVVRHRIRMNDKGAVARGALQEVEAPFGAGDKVEFVGQGWVELDASDASDNGERVAQQLAIDIQKGLVWLPAMGAMKGCGFGKVEGVKVEHAAVPSPDPCKIEGDADRFGIALAFDRPICFARPQIGKTEGNRFESHLHVPGAAIIAALAARWPQGKKHQLERLAASHAQPQAANGCRPLAIPLSLAVADDGSVHDLAMSGAGGLIGERAPAFRPDWKWKVESRIATSLGWPELDRLLEVHTAVVPVRNIADEGQLFSIESIDTRNRKWLADIDLGLVDVAEKDEVRTTLGRLLAEGLWPLGKTDARASVDIVPAHGFAVPVGGADAIGEKVVLVLATATELLAPIPKAKDITSVEHWRAAYDSAFRKISDGALVVDHLFTREQLAGGGYLQRRFGEARPYRPRLLTEAGSVFVLTVRDERKAQAVIQDWLRHGLPSPAGDNWRTCPYRRQNGYGEVVIDPCPSFGE